MGLWNEGIAGPNPNRGASRALRSRALELALKSKNVFEFIAFRRSSSWATFHHSSVTPNEVNVWRIQSQTPAAAAAASPVASD